MARPLPTKSTVDLAAPVVRVSRIRRDPPPPEKKVTAAEIKERESWTIAVGVVVLALALVVALAGISSATGWTARDYLVRIEE